MNEKVEQLLNQVKTIDDAYRIVKRNTGEDFNLFQILGMETAEVKTHSKFLAELLNPKGSHLQGDIFLKLFVEYLNNANSEEENTFLLQENKINLNSEKSQIQVEKHIGKIFDNEGGRIDITIEDTENRLICIENKIYAGEQDNQLLRYKNFGDKFKECHLIFLTLNGNKSSTLNEEDGIVYSISYKKHIIEWLELCKKEAVNLPILRETIGQYINLIKKLTHQTTNKEMEKDIINLLLKNKSHFESAKLINNTVTKIESDLNRKLDDLVTLGNNDKLNIDNIIKSDLPNCYLRMVKKFLWQGVKMIRYDIVLKDNDGKYEVIAIQLEIIDYKIHNNVWANDVTISNHLKETFGRQIDFNFEYEETKEEILIKIKEQMKFIGNEVKFLLEKSSDKSKS